VVMVLAAVLPTELPASCRELLESSPGDLMTPRSAQSLRASASSRRARLARALVLAQVVPARRAASIERLARAVYGWSCPGVRGDRQRCVPTSDAGGVLSRAADVIAGGLGEPLASCLTGFAVCEVHGRGVSRPRCATGSCRRTAIVGRS
jgi:hypothetical protein